MIALTVAVGLAVVGQVSLTTLWLWRHRRQLAVMDLVATLALTVLMLSLFWSVR